MNQATCNMLYAICSMYHAERNVQPLPHFDYRYPAHSTGVLNYTASATNVLWAAKKLGGMKLHQRNL
jgi:hypothetical protein